MLCGNNNKRKMESRDARRAMSHIRRAAELINQSQLGFGKEMKKSRESHAFGATGDEKKF